MVVGTFRYMAPEMLDNYVNRSRRVLNEKLDTWSTGITLFLALTKEQPYEYDGDEKMYLNRIVNGEVNTSAKKYQKLTERAKHFISECKFTF